jgi:putative phage-type endonuclease
MKSPFDLVQGTREWLEWRRGGIGASEAPAILGVCKFNTAYDVYLDKLGLKPAFDSYAARRGTELEAKARLRYELFNLEDMPPALAVHPKYRILRCSLDGIRADGKLLLEIKCPGKETHEIARKGKVPEHYWPQVQYQLAVTGADHCDYFSFGADETHALITVESDVTYQGRLINECLTFWERYVLTKTPPPLTDRDTKVVTDPEIEQICLKLVHKDQMTKAEVDQIKAQVIELAQHPKVKCGVFQISTVKRQGKFSHHKLTIHEDAG